MYGVLKMRNEKSISNVPSLAVQFPVIGHCCTNLTWTYALDGTLVQSVQSRFRSLSE